MRQATVAALTSSRPPMSMRERVRDYLEEELAGDVEPLAHKLVSKAVAHSHDAVLRVSEWIDQTHLRREIREALNTQEVKSFVHIQMGKVVAQDEEWTTLCYSECPCASCNGHHCPHNAVDRVPTETYRELQRAKGKA